MKVNLGNVNISLKEFQKVSEGVHNAGEVKLSGENALTKMNNHVTVKILNRDKISHAEVIAIKEALVKALEGGGVDKEEINAVRREIGLAVDGDVGRGLAERSMKPLSRQQIRLILDRNAEVLNKSGAADVRIRTSAEIYGSKGMDAGNAEDRDAVNAALAAPSRKLSRNDSLLGIQRLIANDVDFSLGAGERPRLLALAKDQLRALLARCDGRPRDLPDIAVECAVDGDQSISIKTGMTEIAFAKRLEDIIARLGSDDAAPTEDETAARKLFRGLGSQAERTTFLDGLRADASGARKARAVAVMLLNDAGISDWQTLSSVNRLSTDDVIALAKRLDSLGANLSEETVRADGDVQALMSKPPVRVPDREKAYIPATSASQYNEAVREQIKNGPDLLFPGYKEAMDDAIDEARRVFGEEVVPKDANPVDFFGMGRLSAVFSTNESAQRATPESVREACRTYARSLAVNALLVKNAPEAVKNCKVKADKLLEMRNQELISRFRNATSAEEAAAALNDCIKPLEDAARIVNACKAAQKGIKDRMLALMSEKTKFPLDELKKRFFDKNFSRAVDGFANDVSKGKVNASSEDEINKAFDGFVKDYVGQRVAIVDQIENLKIDQVAKEKMQKLVTSGIDVKYINVERLAVELEGIVEASAEIDNALGPNAADDDVLASFKSIDEFIDKGVTNVLGGIKAGAEERGPIEELFVVAISRCRPGLDQKLEAFFARPSIVASHERFTNLGDVAMHARKFLNLAVRR